MWMKAVFPLCLTLALLAGCGGTPADAGSSPSPSATPEPVEGAAPASLAEDETPDYVTLRLVDGAETGELVRAVEGAGEGDTRTVGELPVTVDGAEASAGDLTDGMMVTLATNGLVLETYPARFGDVYGLEAETPIGGSYTDLCGFYLKVLDDLWQVDSGLNSGITQAAVDLSQAPGNLTEGEKDALIWCFGRSHGVDAFAATWDELAEGGYLTEAAAGEGPALYQWEDGCHFSITPHEGAEGEAYSLPVLRFDAEKHRSPLGAYFFYDCTAIWPESGTWSDYQVGAEMIS